MSSLSNEHPRLTKVESFSLTGMLTEQLVKWNRSETHSVMGPVGARVGAPLTFLTEIVDTVAHLALAAGKTATGIVVSPYNAVAGLINKKYKIVHKDLELSSAVVHVTMALKHAVSIFVIPIITFLDPERANALTDIREKEPKEEQPIPPPTPEPTPTLVNDDRIKKLEEQIKEQNEEIKNLETEKTELDNQIKEKDEKITEKDEKIENQKTKKRQLKNQIEEKDGKIDELEEEKFKKNNPQNEPDKEDTDEDSTGGTIQETLQKGMNDALDSINNFFKNENSDPENKNKPSDQPDQKNPTEEGVVDQFLKGAEEVADNIKNNIASWLEKKDPENENNQPTEPDQENTRKSHSSTGSRPTGNESEPETEPSKEDATDNQLSNNLEIISEQAGRHYEKTKGDISNFLNKFIW